MDKIIRCLICDGQISLTVLDTARLVNRAIEIHSPSGRSAELFGGLLTCGAYLASGLKSEKGSVSLTVKAAEGDGAVSVSVDKELHVRGYADGSCEERLAGGSLTVVREDGYSLPFVGSCEIESDDISDMLEIYFQQSEQIPTAVCLKTVIGGDGKCLCAGGVVMQLLPDAGEEQIETAGKAFEKYRDECGSVCLGAANVFEQYFSGLVSGGVYETVPVYKCNCSEKKIAGVLASVGRAELLKIADEQGEVRVHCHYCNKDYVYDRKRIEETFAE